MRRLDRPHLIVALSVAAALATPACNGSSTASDAAPSRDLPAPWDFASPADLAAVADLGAEPDLQPQSCGGRSGLACPAHEYCEFSGGTCGAADQGGTCLHQPRDCVGA